MKAFSFIEIVIGLAITSTVFVALFSLAFQNVTTAQIVKNKLVAVHLAQEGIEVVINMRAVNWIAGRTANDAGCAAGNWRQGLCDGSYIVQYNSAALVALGDARLLIDNTTGNYCHAALGCAGANSLYSRTITISTTPGPGGDHQMKIVSQVDWTYNGNPYSIAVEERLYNWY